MNPFPDARFLTSAYRVDQLVADEGAEVAFAGRSNAGKSSAINAIVARRDFARTSKTPGRTQLINFFELSPGRRLVDLPGYGYARVSREMRAYWQELMEDYFRSRRSLEGLLIAVDARRGPSDFDWQMLDWAQSLGCPVHVLLTKSDKLNRVESARVLSEVRRELGTRANVQLFSATTRLGVDQARALVGEWLARQGARGEATRRIDGTG